MAWHTRLRRQPPAATPAPTPAPPAPPVAPVPPADPNAPYIFRPGPAPATSEGVVTLDELYHLSRSP